MAFKLVKKLPSLKWPVLVSVPIDGGKTKKEEFTAEFKCLNLSEYNEALKSHTSDEGFLKAFLIGWEGLQDENGAEIPFSPEIISDLCAFPFMRQAVIQAYNQAVTGIAAKN